MFVLGCWLILLCGCGLCRTWCLRPRVCPPCHRPDPPTASPTWAISLTTCRWVPHCSTYQPFGDVQPYYNIAPHLASLKVLMWWRNSKEWEQCFSQVVGGFENADWPWNIFSLLSCYVRNECSAQARCVQTDILWNDFCSAIDTFTHSLICRTWWPLCQDRTLTCPHSNLTCLDSSPCISRWAPWYVAQTFSLICRLNCTPFV